MNEEQKIGILSKMNLWLIENEGFISIIAVLISLIAIGISIYIANRQNKIGLFEKRYEVYKKYIELKTVREGLNITTSPPGMEDNPIHWRGLYIRIVLSKGSFEGNTYDVPIELRLIQQIKEDIALLEQINYLFPLKKDDKVSVNALVTGYEHFFKALIDHTLSIKEAKESFINTFDKHFPEVIKLIEKNLNYK